MKYLSDYVNDAQTALFEETGTFFAFSNEQLKGRLKDGVNYVNMGIGMICPKDNVDKLVQGLDEIRKRGIAQDLAENGRKGVIRRELRNYECFHVGDISDAVGVLNDYGISEDEVRQAYFEERETAECL